jgi:hypothetical protein
MHDLGMHTVKGYVEKMQLAIGPREPVCSGN